MIAAPGAAVEPARARLLLAALMVGNLVIGTGVLAPAGLLDRLAEAFSVSIARAGALMWGGAVVLGVGAPLLAWALARVDRRRLLAGSLLLYVAGYLASLAVTDFAALLAIRIVTVVAACIYTPQAAVVVGLALPAHQRAAGVTFIFVGWSLAAAVGMPIASFVGARFGWQAAYAGVAALSLLQAIVLWRLLPAGLQAPVISFRSWGAVARDPRLLAMLSVTVVSMTSLFAVFTYLAPELRRMVGVDAAGLALLLALYGCFGVAGNLAASRLVGRFGADATLFACLAVTAFGMLLWAIATGSLVLVVASLLFLGSGGFASNSLQQARLGAAAPALAPATIALNTTCLYIGQGIGGLIGATLFASGQAEQLGWIGCGFALLAAALVPLGRRRASPATADPASADPTSADPDRPG